MNAITSELVSRTLVRHHTIPFSLFFYFKPPHQNSLHGKFTNDDHTTIGDALRCNDSWDLHVSLEKNPRVTSYLRPVYLVILGHGMQLLPRAEGEVKSAGGAEPILWQPGCQLRAALAAAS
jgi:hypothetical protein